MMLSSLHVTQQDSIPAINIDTISVWKRNSIEDVTFYDSTGLLYRIGPARPDNFPYIFLKKNSVIAEAKKAALVKHLRQGTEIPLKPMHSDWIILIILLATFLFSLIGKSTSK